MKKFRKALLSLVLVLGMVVTMLQGSIPASADEAENPMRALWLRPKEKTAAQVEAAVEKIADAGINTIFLETVFNGYTIFPVDYDYTYQNPMYNGFDVLQAYIDECHERGIQLHCWVESFFIGMAWENNGGPVYAAKKDWLLTDTNGNNYEDTMYGPMYFLNPARPECREWIVGLYEILVENYDIDGLQLDYVRYPERSNSIDYGFDDFTISAFEDEYGVSPYDAPSKFIQFKQDQVTEFVKACAFNLKGIDPGLILSLSVYPFYSDGKSLFMQSAQLWMEEGYGDLVVPMAYYENQVSSITNSTINIAGGSEKNVVIGISTQSGFAINSLVNQANAVLNKGAGVAFFEYESFFNGGYADALAEDTLSDTQFNIDREVYKSSVDLEIPERPENPEEPEDPVKPEEPTIPENAAMVTFANGYDWTAQVNQIYMFATDDATASISSLTGQDAATYAWFHTVVLEENEDGNYEVKAAGFGKDTGAIAETLGAGKVIIMAHDTTSYVDSFNWLKALAVGDVVAMNSAWDEVNGTYGDVEVYFSIADEEPEVPVEPEQPTHENVIHYAAVEPGCHYNGSIEYWFCPDCEGFWTDEALTQVTNSKSVILPATGEGNLVHMEAVAPGCHYVGNIEYWVCYDCEQVWQDEALTQLTNIKNVIVPATGSENLEHVEAVAATCYTEGNVEYWFCPDCEGFWTDEACTQLTNSKNVIVPMIGHANKVHMEAVEPGCHYVGHVEHWYCPDCETVWADEELTQITNHKNVIVPELGGEVIHVEAKAPTATEDGNIEYWYCEDCEQVWQDEARTQLTNFKNVILPATGETPADPETPADKDDAEKPADKAPETGDGAPIVVYAVTLMLAAAAIVVALKKKIA